LSDLPTGLAIAYFSGCTSLTAASMGVLVSIQTCDFKDIGWDEGEVDTVIASIYAARENYTYATPSLDISGTNADPSAGEIAHINTLINDYDWSITY